MRDSAEVYISLAFEATSHTNATWTKENQDPEENEEHNKDQEQSRADDGPLHNYISTNLLCILNETNYY